MRRSVLFLLILFSAVSLSAEEKIRGVLTPRGPEGFVEQTWMVDGVKRSALIRVPAGISGEVAVVFCWHGHGGRSAHSAVSWAYDKADASSILVVPQGLPTVSLLVDREGRLPGWQRTIGGEGDRDIHLFDAILADLKKKYSIDDRRIFSMGHSNGAAFSYLLWQARPEVLAAIGSVAGGFRGGFEGLTPMPVIHIAGENDPLVKFTWQQMTFVAVRKFNGCTEEAKPWAKAAGIEATIYASSKSAPLVTGIHSGGHEYPRGATELIVRFFKENPKPAK